MKRIKAGILTFHASNNSGSMLQAHALQKIIKEEIGIDNEIIDFSNIAQKRMYSLFVFPKRIKEFIKNIVYLFFLPILLRYQRDYKNFSKRYFYLSEDKYTTFDELNKLKNEYDYLITGSDQVWNFNAIDFDDSYFLSFGTPKRKIAYAVSLGASDYCLLSNSMQEKYRNYLDDFYYISVREFNAKTSLNQLTKKNIDILADPTLLLDKEYWVTLQSDRVVKSKYIFWYAMTYTIEHLIQIKNASIKYKLPVYIFDTKEWIRRGLAFHNIKLAKSSGPSSLLSLINNAEIIITSSLHGSIFSTLFEKNFWYYQTSKHNIIDDRATFLLAQLNQSDRLLKTNQLLDKNLLKEPDYSLTSEKIVELRQQSINLLKKSIYG